MSNDPQSASKSAAATTGNSGKWFLAVLGLALALIGGIFVWLLGRSFLRAYEMRSWPEVACVIISSEINERRHDENSPMEFRHDVSFGYEWMGETRTSSRVSLRGSAWSSKRGLIEQRASEWSIGMATTCRVSPQDPDFAVLKPDSLAPGYSIWFPGLFLVGGLVMTFRAVQPKKYSLG